MATAEWGPWSLRGLQNTTCLKVANPALKHDDWHRRGPNFEPGLVRELLSHQHKGARHRSESAERSVVRMYTGRPAPIRKHAQAR